jgi:hypothetical protein
LQVLQSLSGLTMEQKTELSQYVGLVSHGDVASMFD